MANAEVTVDCERGIAIRVNPYEDKFVSLGFGNVDVELYIEDALILMNKLKSELKDGK